MGQRHNRRRTRPRSRNRSSSLDTLIESNISDHIQHSAIFAATAPAEKISEPAILQPLASTRHTWLEEWQSAEHNESETDLCAMQQYRLFGGEPGDDANLCYNMLDYFDRLDYMNTWYFLG